MKYLKIKKNTDYQKIFNRGKRVFSPCITLLYFKSDKTAMGIAVSKKHGKAVVRNRIKRLIREVFRQNVDKLEQPNSLIIMPKVADKYSFEDFEKSLLICFKKVNNAQKAEKML